MPIGAARGALIRQKTVELSVADWYGLVDFGATNDSRYYTIPNVAALNLGNGAAWAWGFMAQVADNDGPAYQYVLNTGTYGAASSFTINLHETGGITPNKYELRTLDADGAPNVYIPSTSSPGGDNVLRLVVVQFNGSSTAEMFFCTPGGAAVSQGTVAATGFAGLSPAGSWYLGGRSDFESTRFWKSAMGGLFRANRLLTTDEIANIAAGGSPDTELGAACVEAWPFLNGAAATEVGIVQGIVATRQGTGWAGEEPPPTGNITIGSFGNLVNYYGGAAKDDAHTFTDPPVVDGGGAKLVIAVVRITGFGQQNNDPDFDPAILTLNGVTYSTLFTRFMVNIGGTYSVQAYVAIWDAPTAGPLVVQPHVNQDFSALGAYYWNVTGLHASPLGAISRNHIGTGTSLSWSINTTAANSLVLYINGGRTNIGGTQDFTPTDGSMTLLAKLGGSTVDGRGAWRAGHRNGLAVGTYQGGGTWSQSEPDQIGGMGIELLAGGVASSVTFDSLAITADDITLTADAT